MAGNDDLHPILSKIHRTLGDVLKAIKSLKGEVTKVHTAVREGTETLRDAIHENIQAQAELKMMERVVEVRSILPQIDAEKERIEVEQEELDQQLERIEQRYEDKHEELDEKAAERIRDVGSHIFEIDEDEFEDGIEDPFVEHVTSMWASLQAHNDEVRNDRREEVEATAGDVVSEIHEFVDRQHELVDRIDSVRTDIDSQRSSAEAIQVPYYVVTVERDGRTERQVVAPSMLRQSDGMCTYSLESFPGVEALIDRPEVYRDRTETLSGGQVRQTLEPGIRDEPPMVSYGSAVEKAVPDRLEVAVEGGE